MAIQRIMPYEGVAPYAFVSYCHKDADRVLPIITALSEKGLRIWFDDGIDPGEEWPEVIAIHLDRAHTFIAFISDNAQDSHNCRREFNYAVIENIPSLIVLLDDITMTPVMKLQMSTLQAIEGFTCSSDEIVQDIYRAPIMKDCIAAANGFPFSITEDERTYFYDDDKHEKEGSSNKSIRFGLRRQSDKKLITLDQSVMKIGRHKECDVVLTGDRSISRLHATIFQSGNGLLIIDNDSLNGTYVNDERIPSSQTVNVAEGDRIEVGDCAFIVERLES